MTEESQDLRKLAYNRQLVSNNRLVLPEQVSTLDGYRVLEKPIYELLIDDLKMSSWTIDELSRKYGIVKEDIREPLMIAMRDPVFVTEGFVPRRVGNAKRNGKGRNVQYALLPIPIEARIFDVTLGLSLLHFDSLLTQHADKLQFLSHAEGLDTFREIVSDCWDIHEEKIDRFISKYDSDCILSALGPLFIPKDRGVYNKIRNKLFEKESLLVSRFIRKIIDRDIGKFRRKFSEGFFDIGDMHATVIALSDLTRFCKYSNRISEHSELLRISESFFFSLFIPVYETDPASVLETGAMTSEAPGVSPEVGLLDTRDKEGVATMRWDLPEYPADDTIAAFYTLIMSQTAKTTEIQNALRSLKSHLQTPGVFDLAVYCLTTSQNTNTQKEAIKLLALLKDDRAVEPLTAAYEQVGVILSVDVIRALGSIGSHAAVPFLLEILNQKRFENRIAAIKTLGQIRDSRAIFPLTQQLLDPRSEVQRLATIALGDMGDTAAGPALINLLHNSTSVVRVEAIRALVKLEYTQAIPVLQQMCNDRSKAVRDEVIKGLELLSQLKI